MSSLLCFPSRGERVPRPALDGLLMTPRAEGKGRAAMLSIQCLLLGKCQTGDPEVLPVPHIYHCVTLSPSKVSLDSQVAHDKADQSERNG